MWNWIDKVNELKNCNVAFIIATITESTGSTPREAGAKMIIESDGNFSGTIGGGHLEELVLADAIKFFEEGGIKTIKYPLSEIEGHLCGGHVTMLLELIGDQPDVYIFGAGHVGQAICQTLKNTPFKVHLIDERDKWINSNDLPSDVIKHSCTDSSFIDRAKWSNDKTYAIIVTPSHAKDESILEQLLSENTKYLGMIGSKRKWKGVQSHLIEKGHTESSFEKVTCPMGIIKAGKSPKEIAICIAAQIIQIHYAK